jgi:hypothetical protein
MGKIGRRQRRAWRSLRLIVIGRLNCCGECQDPPNLVKRFPVAVALYELAKTLSNDQDVTKGLRFEKPWLCQLLLTTNLLGLTLGKKIIVW